MAYTYYNSKPDGTPDQQITSGQVNALFPTLTSQDRLNGVQQFSKLWIQSDQDITAVFGLNSPGHYGSYVFVSANENDTEGDLTGSETKYGAVEVVSATATEIVFKNDTNYTLIRGGDVIIVASKAYTVDTVTDNGDGTSTVTATIDYIALPAAGDYITSTFDLSLVTATSKPIWREEKVQAGAQWYDEYSTADILIAD